MTTTAVVVGETLSIDFDWNASGSTGFVDFTVADAEGGVSLFFTDYSALFRTSFYSLDVLDSSGGTAVQRLTSENSCFVTGVLAGQCDAVSGDPSGGAVPDSENALFVLEEGSYRLGFVELDRPSTGSAGFEVSAVPLPAGIVLLLGGLGVLGFASRRTAASA